tara:strand:+ start:215 stop:1075 length:861 start_codon:yes stop_codon:yes gene_type:complete
MEPKAHDAIDSLLITDDGWDMSDLYSNWRKLVNAESDSAEVDALVEFYKNADAGPMQKVYTPGEHELLARTLNIEEFVNPYMYQQSVAIKPGAFEALIEARQQGKELNEEDVFTWTKHREIPWDVVMHDAPTGTHEKGMGKEYSPDESPLIDMGEYYNINPETIHGKNVQGILDFAYTDAKLNNRYAENPDTGEWMLMGKEPLLGNVYFEEDGSFVDVWDVGLGEHESVLPPLGFMFNPKESYVQSLGYNIGREIAGTDYEKNVPIIKGRAYLLGDISPYMPSVWR